MHTKPYVMLYTDKQGVRGQWYGHDPMILSQRGQDMLRWAVYRTSYHGRPFHNATDSKYLVCHDDVYWHNVERKTRHGMVT